MKISLGVLVGLMLALGACSSPCSTYADVELECGDYSNAADPAMERKVAKAFCMASQIEDENDLAKSIKHDVECARKHPKSCEAYLKCKERDPRL